MSLGAPDRPGVDPLERAVAELSAKYGTLFVTAAGNSGADRTIDSPGGADAALTVGAVDKTGVLDRPWDDPEPLPLTMVKFAPEGLDLYDYAPAGATVRVPITVRHRTPVGPASLSVEVSFDDGATWTPAPVEGTALSITGPSSPGFVSLRTTATDTEGDTAEHTVIRAYGVR